MFAANIPYKGIFNSQGVNFTYFKAIPFLRAGLYN